MTQSALDNSQSLRPQWYSRIGFILAAVGSAIGLGNIWRFAYLCYKNGGGAFLIPYVIALLVVGIPIMILELGIGHRMRGSAPLSFAKIDRHWEWCGWWAVVCAMFGIMLYYSTVISWCLSYVFFSFNLSWGSDPNDFFFNQYLQISSGPFDLGDLRPGIMFSLVAVWILSWLVVFFGVQKGVERANKIFMPVLIVLILVLVLWSVNLEGAGKGIAVYLTPDFEALRRPQIWIDAFSQIFFTLSLAFGIMIAYASYLPQRTNLVKDAIIISFGNCIFSFVAGFAVFGTLGYMAHSSGQEVADVVRESIGLAFVAYPQAISMMPAFASLFGVLFFSSLVIAGLTSAVSLVEAFTCALIDKFNFNRRAVVSVICLVGFIGSIIFSAKSGLYWVDIVDHFLTQYGLVLIGFIQCLLIGWVFGADKLRQHIEQATAAKLTAAWELAVKYIVPVILALLFINSLLGEFAEPYGGYSAMALLVIGRDWLMLTLIAALLLSVRPWRARGANQTVPPQ